MPSRPRRRLVYVKAADLELWRCRPIGSIDVLDLRDRLVGHFDGLVIDDREDRPLFLVIRREGRKPQRFLVPIGDAWFDETQRALRLDVRPLSAEAPAFDPGAFAKTSEAQAAAYERKVLSQCCPEVSFHRDGVPDYGKLSAFQCPTWVKEPAQA